MSSGTASAGGNEIISSDPSVLCSITQDGKCGFKSFYSEVFDFQTLGYKSSAARKTLTELTHP